MAIGVLCLGATAALAQGDPGPLAATPVPATPAATAPATGPEAEIARVSAPVELDGTTLFHVRGVALYPADERARLISERLEDVAGTWTIPVEAVRAAPEEYVVNIVAANRFLMLVTDADARIEDVDRRVLARAVVERIQRGIRAYRAARQPEAFARGAWRAAGATALLVAALAAFLWVVRRLEALFGRSYESKISSLQFQSFEILRAQRVRAAARALLRGVRAAALAVLVYFWLQAVLGSFPATRALSGRLLSVVVASVSRLFSGAVGLLPELVVLLVIYLLTRWLLGVARLFFDAVRRGSVRLSGFEPEWSLPTYQIVRMLVVAFALVAAYPYIPGSRSASFQSISIFLGVLVSIGSSGFVANVIAGYSMTYRRAFRLGDRIRVAEFVGDVIETRLQVTHLRSIRNEEIVVPNSTLLTSTVVNYSGLARSRGLILHTTVGIGYETPWRQVEAMLLEAARRTEGLARDPAPFVLHKELGDFCVVYELNVHSDAPTEMEAAYTRLHRSILDVFNEYGVQIMTPAYESDPEDPKVVPREMWWAAPARPSAEDPSPKR